MRVKNYHLYIFLCLFTLFITNSIQAQVTGNVFRDFNANGIKTTAAPDPIEVGLKDVTVNAYDAAGGPYTATTDASGNYTIAGGTGPYRVEFVLPTGYYASNGTASNTTVQFVAAGVSANLGVNSPEDYSQANPLLATPVYINGYGSTENVLIGFPYNSTSTAPPTNVYSNAVTIGGTWGVAYQKTTKTVFTSAIVKRHIGLGPLGIGGIYKVSSSALTSSAQNFVDVSSLGIDVGTIADNVTRGLLTDHTQPNYDVAAFALTGKIGIGDLDISSDNKKLYFINLKDRKLYSIVIDSDNNSATAPTATDIASYTIPDPVCNNGVARPWAIEVHRGKVYVGVVCTGENGGTTDDLSATIYAMDEATGVFNSTPIFSFPLTYPKLNVEYGAGTRWLPWTDTQADIPVYSGDASIRPEAILADIEFDVDGSMVLTFNDRSGHQLGYNNYGTDITSTNLYRSEIGGDILRVYNNNGIYELEHNGIAGPVTGSLQNNNGGPGAFSGGVYSAPFGEFYDDLTIATVHEDCPMGGSALLAGSGQVIVAFMDPINWRSGGFVTWSNTTGTQVNNYELYINNSPANFGKANGIGDVELLSDAQPLEIGNRVFMDTDSDGEQDADEMGIDGVTVKLYKAGTEVGSTTTANGGQWYFNNTNVNLNGATELLPNTAYEVKILAASFPSGKSITTSNTASNAKDLIDSDATLSGSDAVIDYTTGNAGENNHTLDFGFKTASSCTITASATGTNPTCPNNDGTITLTLTNASGTQTYLWSNGATTQNLSTVAAGPYTVTVTDAACTATATATIEVIPTNIPYQLCVGESYTLTIPDNTLTGVQWKKDGVDIAGANALTLNVTQAGVYTYTSNGVGGCAIGNCCPIEFTLKANCCKPNICLPVTVVRH